MEYTYCFPGNSAATPLAAGVAGLVLSANPDLTRDQVLRILQDTADRIDDSAGEYNSTTGYGLDGDEQLSTHGYGRINAFEAVRVVAPTADGGKGGLDVMIRDNRLDWGNTEKPSNRLFPGTDGWISSWYSVDIKVDAMDEDDAYYFGADDYPITSAAFDAFEHENPVADKVNQVYVRIRNRGPVTADAVTVKLHWAFTGTAMPRLPNDFWTAFPDDPAGTSLWNPLPQIDIQHLVNSGSSAAHEGEDGAEVAVFDFHAPAVDLSQPKARNHCLFAVVEASSTDPDVEDAVSERNQTQFVASQVVLKDNNVAQRNVVLVDTIPETAAFAADTPLFTDYFYVRNPYLVPVAIRLKATDFVQRTAGGRTNWRVTFQQVNPGRPNYLEPDSGGLPSPPVGSHPTALPARAEVLVKMEVTGRILMDGGTLTVYQEGINALPSSSEGERRIVSAGTAPERSGARIMGAITYEFR